MDLNTIAEYVQRYREGDTEAFEELYKLTSSRVYFVCLNMLGSEQDANDAMQDTYLTACKNIRQLNDPKRFSSWVERIAINRCKDILKKKIPTPVDDEFIKETLLAEDELTLPEEYILKADKRKTLMKIMREQLSELQFQTVILYYFSNLSIAETAEVMGCSEGSVMNRLAVSRAKIKKYVEEQERNTGSKLFVFAGVPFLTKLFAEECETIGVPALSTDVLGQAAAMYKSSSTAEIFAKAGKAGLSVMSKKGLIIAASAALVGVGVGAIILSGNSTKKPQEPITVESIIAASRIESIASETYSEPVTNADSDLESYDKLIGNMLDFSESDLPEINGHIIMVGGGSSDYRHFVMTDDHKVYIKKREDSSNKFVYFCTVDDDTEEMLSILPFQDNMTTLDNDDDNAKDQDHLMVRKKDGSYVYYNTGIDKPIEFSADGLVYAQHYYDGLKLYTLEDSTLYVTELNDDGSVKTEKTAISVKAEPGEKAESKPHSLSAKYTYLDNVQTVIDSNYYGIMVLTDDHKIFHINEDDFVLDMDAPDVLYNKSRDVIEMPENTDKILPCIMNGYEFLFSETGEDGKMFVRKVSKNELSDEGAVREIALPDGVTLDDIEIICSTGSDRFYIATTDKKIYIRTDLASETGEGSWKLNNALSELYADGKIVNFYAISMPYALCDDGNLYDMTYRVFDDD